MYGIYEPKIGDYVIANQDLYQPFARYHEVFSIHNIISHNIIRFKVELKSYFGRIITIENYLNNKDWTYFNKINHQTLSKKIQAKFKSEQVVHVSVPGFPKITTKINQPHLIHYKNQKPTARYSIKLLKEFLPSGHDYWTLSRLETMLLYENNLSAIINYNEYWAKLNEL